MATKFQNRSGNIALSVVTPAYHEAKNLPLLYQRLKKALDPLKLRWEWIVVDDHSGDDTYAVVKGIARKDPRVRVIQFTRNCGAHLALVCALRAARGQCAVGLAADLQDPPEIAKEMLALWRNGSKVVWAVRAGRKGESLSTLFFSRSYYFLVRNLLGLKRVPSTGADFFLIDQVVLKAISKAYLKNKSLLLWIGSLDVQQDFITYEKQERVHGRSGWSLKKKLKLIRDSFLMFPQRPFWFCLVVGLMLIAAGAALGSQNSEALPRTIGILSVFLGFTTVGIGSWIHFKGNNLNDGQPGTEYPIK